MDKQGTKMRLSCPNCGAQYEVPAEVIPQDGRDVQCSNCGHTWFQLHPDNDADLAQETGASLADEGWSPEAELDALSGDIADDPNAAATGEVQPPDPVFDDEGDAPQPPRARGRAAESPRQSTAPAAETADAAAGDTGHPDIIRDRPDEADLDSDEDDTDDDFTPPPSAPARRSIDASVADVLRQEAEYEAQVREAEARDLLETQSELGLDTPDDGASRRADEARSRMRRIRGLPDTEPEAPPAEDPAEDPLADFDDNSSRRNLLPDIEEINSTLRSTEGRSAAEGDVLAISSRASRRSGFRLGFGVSLLVAALVILAYVYNQDITAAWPASEPYMDRFMEQMNALRVWLDTRVTDAMLWLNAKTGAGSS
ncbi:zinc-ribbon domain-containing protein [Shimia sp.]|uniref:zinc-ribbon domain-containing protein n=1 Tax=Shimia sp. TaxID=1954381 RepID=UPI00356A33A3